VFYSLFLRIVFIMKVFFPWFFLLILVFCSNLQAETVTLPSGQEISVENIGNPSAKNHLLWVHSTHGISEELTQTITEVAEQEAVNILLPDWLDSYFIPPSRLALEKIPEQDFIALVKHYAQQYPENFFLLGTGRAASLVLKAAYVLQTEGINNIQGIILIAPYLQKGIPDIGKDIDYQEITTLSNLPLYVIQAERSPRYLPFPKLIQALEKGGSPVYTHILKDIRGGYHERSADQLKEKDIQARAQFPSLIGNALQLLKTTEKAPLPRRHASDKITQKSSKPMPMQLQQVSFDTPDINLTDLEGRTHKLADYHGKIVLVSFWASWCRPCIEEMPSLVQLKNKYADKLEILAVNIGEDKKTISQFIQKMQINFPILLDTNSHTVKAWKVFVYPSNYIVDGSGQIRYASTGALDWQDPAIDTLMESLLRVKK